MAKKNDHSRHKIIKNQIIAKDSSFSSEEIINFFNRIINTQTHLIQTNFKLKSFFHFVLSQVQNLTKAKGAAIELIEDNKTVYNDAIGSLKKYVGKFFNIDESISSLSINTHQIIRYDDSKNDVRINQKINQTIGKPSSIITAPLFYQGHVIGAIKIVADKTNYFNDTAVQILKIMANLIDYGISQQRYQEETKKLVSDQTHLLKNLRKAEKKLKFAAHHDYLTGLLNRNLFDNQLLIAMTKAKRKKQLVALMILDIDHFKKVNETLGHSIGDKLLYAFAMRLKQCIRSSDIIARFGGDEFILLIDDLKEAQDAILIVDKILQSIRKPFNINKKFLNVTTSIGVTFLNDPDISPDEFIKQADQALYISKNSGRNTFYIFNDELTHEQKVEY